MRFSSDAEYWKSCESAATWCAEDIPFILSHSNVPDDELAATRPELSRSDERIQESLRLVLKCYESENGYWENVRELAVQQQGDGAVTYMLAYSAALRTAVTSIVTSQQDLSASLALKIDAVVRFYLNNILANKSHAIYAPAVARAYLLRTHRDHVIEQLIKRVDNAVMKLTGNKIQCSSVVQTLISRSKGDPANVIKEALDLRNTTSRVAG